MWSGYNLKEDQQYELKIDRKHLLLMGGGGVHCTKFSDFQAKGLKDIKQTSFGLQSDRSTEWMPKIAPFFEEITASSPADQENL